ncbi:hypothetical protein PR202_gb09448 [Eleusine coracana subsp. coracana]|uniref:Uncharacterized protein n=1 Tax=Eleusine coracana subsp. coracana TaxID=191504 RepID=A0AAV5EI13_ELECO|nr:hypothetical protein PR202_gb09448 [Eleusine coracana subsp. coracana]
MTSTARTCPSSSSAMDLDTETWHGCDRSFTLSRVFAGDDATSRHHHGPRPRDPLSNSANHISSRSGSDRSFVAGARRSIHNIRDLVDAAHHTLGVLKRGRVP